MTPYTIAEFASASVEVSLVPNATMLVARKRDFRKALLSHVLAGGKCPDVSFTSLPTTELMYLAPDIQKLACPHLYDKSLAAADFAEGSLAPGHCYLLLFKAEFRQEIVLELMANPLAADVFDYLAEDVDRWSTGRFQVTLGTKYGIDMGIRFHCHITSVSANVSNLGVFDLISAIPGHYRIGGDDEPEVVVSKVSSQPSVMPDYSLLGTVYDGRSRRFAVSLGQLKTSKFATTKDSTGATVDTTEHCGSTTSYTPSADSDVTDFIRYFATARIVSLAVELIPLRGAPHYWVTLHEAWIPAAESVPTSSSKFEQKPTHQKKTLGPVFPGGKPDTVSSECTFSWGVQRILKPTPHFGNKPVFCYLAYDTLLNTAFQGDAADIPLYDLFAVMTVVVE